VEIRIVNLETGEYTDQFDPAAYDLRKAARDPALSEPIPPDLDIANIKRKAKYAPVYLVKEDGKIKIIILPVHGYGLWSTMYGFLALESDTKTIHGLKFYEHAETPGLGGEITNPKWLAKWDGKVVYDEQWQPDIQVIKGTVDPNKPGAEHEVDGIAGATLTSRGVMHLMQYWLSDQGYGPFLARLRNQTQANRG
jgi:Na+-transporting NADH:ubiquinone oxidoreductase subunit C